jgi:hypothetical protein
MSLGFAYEFFHRIKDLGIRYISMRDTFDISKRLSIGGVVADDSSRIIKPRIISSDAKTITFSRIRFWIAGIAPFSITISDGILGVDVNKNEMQILPEGFKKGKLDIAFDKIFIEPTVAFKSLGEYDIHVITGFVRKIKGFDKTRFIQMMISRALEIAEKSSSLYDISIVMIDGSIIPLFIPEIYFGLTKSFEYFLEFIKIMMEKEREILERFINIYERVYKSKNIVMIGAVKKSTDKSLQRMAGMFHEDTDQELLERVMKKENIAIIGPFVKRRVFELNNMLRRNNMYNEDVSIISYYMKGSYDMTPLQLEFIFSRNMDYETRDLLIKIIYKLLHKDKFGRPTLWPIHIIDETMKKESKRVETMFKKKIKKEIYVKVKEYEEKFRSCPDREKEYLLYLFS